MSNLRLVGWTFAVGLITLGAAYGQNYPSRPIRVFASAAGSGSDFVIRLIAPGLSSSLGQQVIIENRGGNATILAEQVSKAAPDGYTLITVGSTLWALPLMQKTTYDPVRDFAPISLTSSAPNILVVHPSLPVKSVRELIALARARPGEINYGSGASGATNQIAAELMNSMAGIRTTRISYNGTGPAMTAVLGGEVQIFFPNVASATPHMKSGRLRVLAVTSLEPTALVPGVPTMASSGLPGYEVVSIIGVFAPARTPAAIINQLSREISRIVRSPEIREKFVNSGADVVGSTPEGLAAGVKNDMDAISKAIKSAGIEPN